MKMRNVRTDVKSLKWFLIQRFLLILPFIYISEELIQIFYSFVVLPFLIEVMRIGPFSIVTRDGNLVSLVLQSLMLAMTTLLPETIRGWLQRIIGRNMDSGVRLNIDSPALEGVQNPLLIDIYQLAVILIFLLMLLIALLPYAIAIYWYCRAVSRKMNELLQIEKEQKEAYDRKRNLLLSDIAHDIKTPITTVVGYAKALSDNMVKEDEKKKEYLQAIYTKSMRMDELITLLFEYVKLDSDGFVLHKEKTDLGELLRENVALLYSDFEEKGMEVKIDIPEGEFSCEVDKVQMSRAVTNILTNSVKYNDRGTKVLISLNEQYQIRIADNGVMIDEELAEHIFEPFSRGDKARSTRGGSGLGLSISAKIIHMHGGDIQLDCQCKDGYTKAFQVTLPHIYN